MSPGTTCLPKFVYLREASSIVIPYTILGSANVVLAIIAILGNCLILYALRKCQSLHAPTKVLLCSLAFSDLSVGLVVNPLFSAHCFAVVFNNVNLFCSVRGPYVIIAYCLGLASLLTMTALALDRFFAFTLKLMYRLVITFKRTLGILAACWVFVIASPFMWLLSEKITGIIAMVIIFCCVILSLVFCIRPYFGVQRHQHQVQEAANSQAQQISSNQSDFGDIGRYKTSLNTLILILCFLFACYLPYFIVVVVNVASNSETNLVFNITCGNMYFNSLIN